tara:strand:- start:101 stop:244 length:144 start_codon:yes stop_codon:yes gene_type:complete
MPNIELKIVDKEYIPFAFNPINAVIINLSIPFLKNGIIECGIKGIEN